MPDFQGIARSAYVRAASTALAVYEYIRMIPTTVDFYRVQWEKRKITVPLVLFVLIRLSSITIIIIGNVGIFYPHFTQQSCLNFFLVPLVFKPLQISISQCIMAVRTYNLAGRRVDMGIFLLIIYTATCAIQWVAMLLNNSATLAHFDPPVVGIRGSCIPATITFGVPSWAFYAAAMIYDVIVSVICAYYLIKYKRMVKATFLSNVMNTMIYEGLLYFVGLTAINTVNLVFYQSPSTSVDVTAVGLGFTLVWILSQNIVLSQYRAQVTRTSLALADEPVKPQQPYVPPRGPSDETWGTYGDTFEGHGEGTSDEMFRMKIFMTVEVGTDRRASMIETRPLDMEAGTSENRTHLVSHGQEVTHQAREDTSP